MHLLTAYNLRLTAICELKSSQVVEDFSSLSNLDSGDYFMRANAVDCRKVYGGQGGNMFYDFLKPTSANLSSNTLSAFSMWSLRSSITLTPMCPKRMYLVATSL